MDSQFQIGDGQLTERHQFTAEVRPAEDRNCCSHAKMGTQRTVCILVAVGLVVLFIAIILPVSFQYAEYFDLALMRRRSTGAVDRSDVYTSARVCNGPDYELIRYPADAQFEKLEDVSVTTKDNLVVTLTVTFQYFLRIEDVTELHDRHKNNYGNVIRGSAIDTIKDEAHVYDTDAFIHNRKEIEHSLFSAVRTRIEGICCLPNCQERKHGCLPGCKNLSICDVTQKGVFVEIRYFQLGEVELISNIMERNLQALILKEEKEKEELEKEATLIRISTDKLVEEIKNQESILVKHSDAEVRLLGTKAAADSEAIIEESRATGLVNLYRSLSITDQEHKNTFDYLRTIRDRSNVHLTVNYQQKISGTWTNP